MTVDIPMMIQIKHVCCLGLFFIENSRHLHNNSLGNGNTNANGWGPGSEIILQ